MEYTVKIEDVTFGYGDRLILQNVSMKFGAGKVVAIMGGSGMGKTTLLKLIGGLLTPQGGRVEVTGETLDPSNQKRLYRIRRRMGMLFQFGALFTDLSVFDNVAFPMREQTDLDEETIRDLVLMKLNAVGLRGAAHLMPSEISGGMARRVALAREIAKTREKITEYQNKLKGLEAQKTEAENLEIVQLVRSMRMTPQELNAMLKGDTIPGMTAAPATEAADYEEQEDNADEK